MEKLDRALKYKAQQAERAAERRRYQDEKKQLELERKQREQ